MTETRSVRILRALDVVPSGLTVPALVAELAEGIEPRGHALSWYGTILRRLVSKGLAERAGSTKGAWQRPGAHIYRITAEGSDYLAWIDDEPRRHAQFEREQRDAAESIRQRRAALKEAARGCPQEASRWDRHTTAVKLREAGCTQQEIAALFGVSREMIRQDLLLSEPTPGKRGRPRSRPRGMPLAEAAIVSGELMLRVGKRTLYFTSEEAALIAKVIAGEDSPAA